MLSVGDDMSASTLLAGQLLARSDPCTRSLTMLWWVESTFAKNVATLLAKVSMAKAAATDGRTQAANTDSKSTCAQHASSVVRSRTLQRRMQTIRQAFLGRLETLRSDRVPYARLNARQRIGATRKTGKRTQATAINALESARSVR